MASWEAVPGEVASRLAWECLCVSLDKLQKAVVVRELWASSLYFHLYCF